MSLYILYVQRCLVKDSHKRMTINEALCHSWLNVSLTLHVSSYNINTKSTYQQICA